MTANVYIKNLDIYIKKLIRKFTAIMKKEIIKTGMQLLDKIHQMEFDKKSVLEEFKKFSNTSKNILWDEFFEYSLRSNDQPSVDLKEYLNKTFDQLLTAMESQIKLDYQKRIDELEKKISDL